MLLQLLLRKTHVEFILELNQVALGELDSVASVCDPVNIFGSIELSLPRFISEEGRDVHHAIKFIYVIV